MAREAGDARSGAAAVRGRAVLAQHGQEFLVRANEEGLVAGLVGRAPDGRVRASTATSAARAVAIRPSATARSTDTVTCQSRRPGLNGRACAG